MKENINNYIHLTFEEFFDYTDRSELCPDLFGLENSKCCYGGDNSQECRNCWEESTKYIPFKRELITFEKESLMIMTHLAQIEKQIKDLNKIKKELMSDLLKMMEKHGVIKFSNDLFTINYTKAHEVSTFDEDKFKKDYPNSYEQYKKKSNKASSITFDLK